MTKRKFDEICNLFDSMSVEEKPKRQLKCITLCKQKYKNIFGLPEVEHKDIFTRNEVIELLNNRDELLYNKYLYFMSLQNVKKNTSDCSRVIVIK